MNEERCISILENLWSILTSPRWAAEVKSFVDEYCITFVDCGDENNNQVEHHALYKEFLSLVDETLKERLGEINLFEEDLTAAFTTFENISSGHESEGLRDNVLQQLLSYADFSEFKIMCIERNIALQSEIITDEEASIHETQRLNIAIKRKPITLTFTPTKDNVDCLNPPDSRSIPRSDPDESKLLQADESNLGEKSKTINYLSVRNIDPEKLEEKNEKVGEDAIVKDGRSIFERSCSKEELVQSTEAEVESTGTEVNQCGMPLDEIEHTHDHRISNLVTIGLKQIEIKAKKDQHITMNHTGLSTNTKNYAKIESQTEMSKRHKQFLTKMNRKTATATPALLERQQHLERQRDLLKKKTDSKTGPSTVLSSHNRLPSTPRQSATSLAHSHRKQYLEQQRDVLKKVRRNAKQKNSLPLSSQTRRWDAGTSIDSMSRNLVRQLRH